MDRDHDKSGDCATCKATTGDPTECSRRSGVAIVNGNVLSDDPVSERARLEERYGKGNVYTTAEMTAAFNVAGFAAPFVIVTRRADGKRGTLTFQHSPRFYFDFTEE